MCAVSLLKGSNIYYLKHIKRTNMVLTRSYSLLVGGDTIIIKRKQLLIYNQIARIIMKPYTHHTAIIAQLIK